MWRIIMLCIATMGIATSNKVSYRGFKLFKIVPKTNTHLRLLQDLKNDTAKYSFWETPIALNREGFIMVPPYNLELFYNITDDFKLPFEVKIDDIQKVIDDTSPQEKSQGFDFKQYHTLEKIYDNLEELAKKYPNKVQVVVGGRTYEGRQIKGVKIISGEGKRGIFIEGGIHAREWISPATVMYILHQLLTSNNSDVRGVADNNNWFIFPVFNPDGYVFSHVKDRLWKKNRKPSLSNVCIGSDLNRNWDFRWNTIGTSNNPCDEDYPGSEPFSEIEAKSIYQYIRVNIHSIKTYVAFRSFSQQVLFPCSPDLPDLYYDLHAFSTIAMEDIQPRYNTQYERGTISEFQQSSGSSVDYIFHVLRRPQVYIYKLRDKGQYGFLLPPEQIIPTGEETLDSFASLLSYML